MMVHTYMLKELSQYQTRQLQLQQQIMIIKSSILKIVLCLLNA